MNSTTIADLSGDTVRFTHEIEIEQRVFSPSRGLFEIIDNIDRAVASIHATAKQIDDGLKRAMPCYDVVVCADKRCGECGR